MSNSRVGISCVFIFFVLCLISAAKLLPFFVPTTRMSICAGFWDENGCFGTKVPYFGTKIDIIYVRPTFVLLNFVTILPLVFLHVASLGRAGTTSLVVDLILIFFHG